MTVADSYIDCDGEGLARKDEKEMEKKRTHGVYNRTASVITLVPSQF